MSKKIFVSGCYDILHGGHIEFFHQAKALGDYLIVSFASDEILWKHKKRKPSIPQQHKLNLLSSLRMVDEVVIGTDLNKTGIEFEEHFARLKPDVLAVTEDDAFENVKRDLCKKYNVEYVMLPKSLNYEQTSTTNIVNKIRTPSVSPLRIDFAGGWLDVPKFSKPNAYIVNCAIQPLVSLNEWPYKQNSGLGGSAAWAYLNGKDCVQSELDAGVGWQDPAIVKETGLCVWRSGQTPILERKYNPDWLNGKMALLYTGSTHVTKDLVDVNRNYNEIANASRIAEIATSLQSVEVLSVAINRTYKIQRDEGMRELPENDHAVGKKYCGSGHGGYALYLFDNEHSRNKFVESNVDAIKIEPYIRPIQ